MNSFGWTNSGLNSALVVAAMAGSVMLAGCKGGSDSVEPGTIAVDGATPSFTPSSGSSSTLLGRTTFTYHGLDVQRTSGDWRMELKASPGFDVAVQNIVFQPGSQSGWHRHPGPVFIQVVSGTISFYESDDPTCTPIIRTAGHGYLDLGDHAHLARNESGVPATNVVTYFAPPGAALRIDAPKPGNCPF